MKHALFLLGFFLVSSSVFARDLKPAPKDTTANAWFQFSGGQLYYDGLNKAISGSFIFTKRHKRNLYSLRLAGYGGLFTSFSDIGFMYGYLISKQEEQLHFSIHSGISRIEEKGTSIGLFGGGSGSYTVHEGVGFPVLVNLGAKLGRQFGLGISYMGNLNSHMNIHSYNLSFFLGDLK
jgi:hypothetical protein